MLRRPKGLTRTSSPFVTLFSDNYFHTSSISCSQASKRINARNKKKNIARTDERIKQASASKPSVVLGTRATEEAVTWGNCKLSKVTVNEELLSTSRLHTEKLSVGNIEIPKELGYGVKDAEKKMLFDDLPIATIHMITQVRQYAQSAPGSITHGVPKKLIQTPSKEMLHEENEREIHKATLLAKALDLRNANADGIAYENRRRIIEAFSTPENPFDSGRTEVQVALLTYKIRNLWKHLTTFKRDVGNRRALRRLIHQRASLLRYLKGHDRGRYDVVLEQLALEPQSVEGELVV